MLSTLHIAPRWGRGLSSSHSLPRQLPSFRASGGGRRRWIPSSFMCPQPPGVRSSSRFVLQRRTVRLRFFPLRCGGRGGGCSSRRPRAARPAAAAAAVVGCLLATLLRLRMEDKPRRRAVIRFPSRGVCSSRAAVGGRRNGLVPSRVFRFVAFPPKKAQTDQSDTS